MVNRMVQYMTTARCLLRGALGLHRRGVWSSRTCRRFDHGSGPDLPHDPDGHAKHAAPGAGRALTTEKVGRVRTCRLGPRRLEEETAWIERHRQLWDARFDALDKVVEELKRKEKVDGRDKRD